MGQARCSELRAEAHDGRVRPGDFASMGGRCSWPRTNWRNRATNCIAGAGHDLRLRSLGGLPFGTFESALPSSTPSSRNVVTGLADLRLSAVSHRASPGECAPGSEGTVGSTTAGSTRLGGRMRAMSDGVGAPRSNSSPARKRRSTTSSDSRDDLSSTRADAVITAAAFGHAAAHAFTVTVKPSLMLSARPLCGSRSCAISVGANGGRWELVLLRWRFGRDCLKYLPPCYRDPPQRDVRDACGLDRQSCRWLRRCPMPISPATSISQVAGSGTTVSTRT
jgi:hypothetical protein